MKNKFRIALFSMIIFAAAAMLDAGCGGGGGGGKIKNPMLPIISPPSSTPSTVTEKQIVTGYEHTCILTTLE